MNQPVVVVGASGHGTVVADMFLKQGKFDVLGFIDSYKAAGSDHCGYRILGTEAILPEVLCRHYGLGCIVAIGDNSIRSQMVERIESIAPDLPFITAIHPSAQIGSCVLVGAGSVVMAGVVINANTTIGAHCIVNTSASLDHDNRWGDFSSIGPGGTTGGNVTVDEFSAVAQRAVILHGRRVGPHTVVGASATVLKDLPGYVVAYGTPARIIRARQSGEKYL